MRGIVSGAFSFALVAGLALTVGCSSAEPIEGAEGPEVSAETGDRGTTLASADVAGCFQDDDANAEGRDSEELSSEPATEEVESGTAASELASRGFGCPDDRKCHKHCRNIRGPSGRRVYSGGDCGGFLNQTCKCYK